MKKKPKSKKAWVFFFVASSSINGHLVFFIHEKVTQVQEGPIFSFYYGKLGGWLPNFFHP